MAALIRFIKSGLRELYIPPSRQILALDGLRSFAILFVFFSHIHILFHDEGKSLLFWNKIIFVSSGWMGVDLFFVLSGYLIGIQLWKEFKNTNRIHYPSFLIKRTVRIWPLYYFCLLFFIVVLKVHHVYQEPIFPDFLFLSNVYKAGVILSSWSLSFEEQFYIFMPLLIMFVGKHSKRLESFRPILIALFLLAPLIRFLSFKYGLFTWPYKNFHLRYDGLILGMLIANYKIDTDLKSLPKFLNWPAVVLFGLVGVITVIGKSVDNMFIKPLVTFNIFNFTCLGLLFTLSLVICLTRENLFTRFLSWKWFYPLSKLSYAMYLIHRLLIKHIYEFVNQTMPALQNDLKVAVIFVISMVICLFLNVVTYIFIEAPIMKRREQIIHFFVSFDYTKLLFRRKGQKVQTVLD